jgi:hypothetical protein
MKSEMRRSLANQSFEEKIRKVGELIELAVKVKTPRSSTTAEEAALLGRLDVASAQLDSREGVPVEKVRKKIGQWATSPKNSGIRFPILF